MRDRTEPTTIAGMDDRAGDDPHDTRIWLRRELVGDGGNDRRLAREVAGGTLVRPRRGAYVAGADWRRLDAPGRHEVTARAVLRQADTELVVSHASAVPFHDGPDWGLDLSQVQVTRVGGRRGRHESGVHQHVGVLLDGDVVQRHGVAVTSPALTALEVTTVAGAEVGLVVLNDFLHRGLATPVEVRARYEQGFLHWPGSLCTDLVIRLASPKPESVGESRFFYLCYREGLPAPEPQYPVHDRTGRLVAVLDFAWPQLGAFAEFDGRGKYQRLLTQDEDPGDVVFREKQREDLVRELTGWRGLRVVWADLTRPRATALRVRRLLEPASGLPGSS